MHFEASIIKNKKYRKYKKLRSLFFGLFLILGTPIFYMLSGQKSNKGSIIQDFKEYPFFRYYLIIFSIIAITYGLIHFFSWKIEPIGILKIDKNSIVFDLDKKLNLYPFEKIKHLYIERGTIFHKEEHNDILYTGNNIIKVIFDTLEEVEYEFEIKSKEHNKKFDEAVNTLKNKLGNKLKYVSI